MQRADNYQDYLDGKNNNYYYHTGDEYATYTITFHGKGSSHTAQLNVNISDLEELLDIPEAKIHLEKCLHRTPRADQRRYHLF